MQLLHIDKADGVEKRIAEFHEIKATVRRLANYFDTDEAEINRRFSEHGVIETDFSIYRVADESGA